MNIYIPTLGRANVQYTWHLIPSSWKECTVLVVHPDEVEEHKRLGYPVLSSPAQRQGIAHVREWIIRYAHAHGQSRIGILDDDITGFCYSIRPSDLLPGMSWNYDLLPGDWEGISDWIHHTLQHHVSCGFAYAEAYPREEDAVIPGRLMHTHFYAIDRLPIDEIDWTGLQFSEDFYVTLQLIVLGYPNAVNTRYRINVNKTEAAGGCLVGGRTLETHNKAMLQLMDLFHPWVQQSNKTRIDKPEWIKVRIRWKALWKHMQSGA